MGFTEIFPLEEITIDANFVIRWAYYLLSQLIKGDGEK